MLHSTTWVGWTAMVMAAAMLTRNPLYLIILLGIVAVAQRQANSSGSRTTTSWQALIRLAVGMALLVIPMNALNSHNGQHVLFRLPTAWPLIGGPITLEAVLWGGCSALSLITLLLLFVTFNMSVGQAQLLRLTPAFVYEAGLVISIALAFVPQMIISAQEIYEAQLIRGQRMRRLRDMLPFVMALLTTGLERSLQLAESMEARGFGNVRPAPHRRDVLLQALTLIGLGGLLGGLFALTYFSAFRAGGWAITAISAALLLSVFWLQGQRVQRTVYRTETWTWRDGAAWVGGLTAMSVMLGQRIIQPDALAYSPYTDLLPPFDPLLGAALLALLVPVMLARFSPRDSGS